MLLVAQQKFQTVHYEIQDGPLSQTLILMKISIHNIFNFINDHKETSHFTGGELEKNSPSYILVSTVYFHHTSFQDL